jgi:hypothetical protein
MMVGLITIVRSSWMILSTSLLQMGKLNALLLETFCDNVNMSGEDYAASWLFTPLLLIIARSFGWQSMTRAK